MTATLPIDPQADHMVDTQLAGRGVGDERVLNAMRRVPRAAFVPDLSATEAYADKALPTADGQTISQPLIVGRMTELLGVRPGDRVLEIGTGSGYQTAVLVLMGAKVVTVERSAKLAERAKRALMSLGLADGVTFVVGDGSLGCAEYGPFDRVLVTAAAPRVPEALQGQTADGGRIVIPIGDRSEQELMAYEWHSENDWDARADMRCRFVPLVGEDAWAAHEV